MGKKRFEEFNILNSSGKFMYVVPMTPRPHGRLWTPEEVKVELVKYQGYSPSIRVVRR